MIGSFLFHELNDGSQDFVNFNDQNLIFHENKWSDHYFHDSSWSDHSHNPSWSDHYNRIMKIVIRSIFFINFHDQIIENLENKDPIIIFMISNDRVIKSWSDYYYYYFDL